MSREILSYFAAYVEKETGIIYADSNLYQLEARLSDFCREHSIAGLAELHQMFTGITPLGLRQKFIDLVTNNETSFFRDPVYFKIMIQYLVNEILPTRPMAIRIWSAAASTGQEAISIAISLHELSENCPLPPWTIVATDISSRALEKIRSGTYSDFELARGMSEERKQKYFMKVADGWKVRPEIHSRIQVQSNNLLLSRITGPFDLVFLRNVLIYQKVEGKRKILDSILRELGPRGALVLGVGETLFGVTENIRSSFYSGVVIYQKAEVKAVA